MRHEALSVPEGIDFDTQRRNLAQRRKNVSSTSLSDIPILPPVILDLVAARFSRERKTTRLLSRYLDRTVGSRWKKKLRNGVDVSVRGIEGGRGVANDEGEAATAV